MFSFAVHCTDRQRLLAGAFSFGLAVSAAAYALREGHANEYFKIADLGNTSRQYFCANCGSRVSTRIDEKPDLVIIRPKQLDEHAWFRPIVRVFTRYAEYGGRELPGGSRRAGSDRAGRGPSDDRRPGRRQAHGVVRRGPFAPLAGIALSVDAMT